MGDAGADRRAKASGFNSFVVMLREELSPEAYGATLARLSPVVRELIDKPRLAIEWMPSTHYTALLNAVAETGLGGDAEGLYDLGRAHMRHDMKTIYRIFMRFVSAPALIERAAKIYSTYTENGRMSAREMGESALEVVIEDVDEAAPPFWHYQRGCVAGVMEEAGFRDVRVELIDGGGNEMRGRFKVSWQPR